MKNFSSLAYALVLPLALALAATVPCFAQASPKAIPVESTAARASVPDSGEIKRLVSNLGATQFVLREEATKRLFDIGLTEHGELARQALETASKQSDREIRERAKRVLGLLNRQLRTNYLADFLAGEQTDRIPGWSQFSTRYGNTKATRGVYGEIVKHEWELLTLCFPPELPNGEGQPNADVRSAIVRRYSEMMTDKQDYESIPLGSLLTYFVIGNELPERFNLQSQLFGIMLRSRLVRQNLHGPLKDQNKSQRAIIRKLVGDWLKQAGKQDQRLESTAMSVALTSGMWEEAKELAAGILRNQDALLVTKKLAMQTFVALKDKTGIPLIEPYVKDDTLLNTNLPTLQIRDVALACLMDLNGHDLAKIGVERVRGYQTLYEYKSLGFATDKERLSAFETYKGLQAEKEFQEGRKRKAEAK